ncbi:hypothetical protein [Nocardia niwae]|uniref:hypothetical protein n=1 Tax=Nocardia niwae TaxID=626084 RepID=UPI0007A53B8D|nr:hypothetical protein [Nocardia niwae]
MSLVTQVSDLATRIATEIKTVRTEVATKTGNLASLTTTDKTNLVAAINEVQSEVGGGGATNLAATLSSTQTVITSDTGTDATIPAVDGTNAGVMTPTMKTKLDGIETAADVTDAANVGSSIHGVSTKATPVAADAVPLIDSEASNVLKKITYANLSAAVTALIVDSAPSTLDTLNELAAALGDDANFATTVSTDLGNRVRVDTAAQGLNSTQKGNARTNIDVYSTTDIGSPTTDFVAVFEAGLV